VSNMIKKAESAFAEWHPLRAMRDFFRRAPSRAESATPGHLGESGGDTWLPSVEVCETEGAYVVRADVPGVAREDLDVSLYGNRLQISGKRAAEKATHDDTFYVCECSYGTFTRAFTLPGDVDVDRAGTDLQDGVLTVTLPKKVDARVRRIAVT
jgi:HSP20 family protein